MYNARFLNKLIKTTIVHSVQPKTVYFIRLLLKHFYDVVISKYKGFVLQDLDVYHEFSVDLRVEQSFIEHNQLFNSISTWSIFHSESNWLKRLMKISCIQNLNFLIVFEQETEEMLDWSFHYQGTEEFSDLMIFPAYLESLSKSSCLINLKSTKYWQTQLRKFEIYRPSPLSGWFIRYFLLIRCSSVC